MRAFAAHKAADEALRQAALANARAGLPIALLSAGAWTPLSMSVAFESLLLAALGCACAVLTCVLVLLAHTGKLSDMYKINCSTVGSAKAREKLAQWCKCCCQKKSEQVAPEE